jgi:diguanylate cyclase (GGDEF)-like protein
MSSIRPILYQNLARLHGFQLNRKTQQKLSQLIPDAALHQDGRLRGVFLKTFVERLVTDIKGTASAKELLESLRKEELASAIQDGTLVEHLGLDNVYRSMVRERIEFLHNNEQLEILEASRRARIAVEKVIEKNPSIEKAERLVMKALFEFFQVHEVKAYDVAEDGSVRVSHSYIPMEGGKAKRIDRGKIESHFSSWVPPEDYAGEAMFEIVGYAGRYALIEEPATDDRCRKELSDGSSKVFESRPFALIGEKLGDRITRVYKVDWVTSEDVSTYSQPSIEGVFLRLAEYKQREILKAERRFLDDIFAIASTGVNLDDVLGEVSGKIAEFFTNNGKGSKADRVTIMLYDKHADSLVTRVIWTNDGIKEGNYFSGPQNKGVGRRIFDMELEKPHYLSNITEWDGRRVEWLMGKEGSLIATKVGSGKEKLGMIVVSSDYESAFTQDQVRVIGDVARRLGPAFERIQDHLRKLNLDTKFSAAKFGALEVYNASYLDARLAIDITLARREETPLSLIYIDLDHFKHLNEAWNHDHVDYVLAKIIDRIVRSIRDGEVYRHGGEEIVVRLSAYESDAAKVAERIRAAIDSPITVKIPFKNRLEAVKVMTVIKKRMTEYPNSGIQEVSVTKGRGESTMLAVAVHKTASLGVVEFRNGGDPDTPESLLRRADEAQQKAKREGKNRVVVA